MQTHSNGEEVTALGAAIAAGLRVGLWPNLDAVRPLLSEEASVNPEPGFELGESHARWERAVEASFGWAN